MPSTFIPEANAPMVPVRSSRPARRWSSAVVAAALVVGIGAGAVVTAAVMERARVTRPDQGVQCHANSASLDGGVVVDIGDDPVTTCENLWREGGVPGGDSRLVPPMVACTGPTGGVDVYPGDDGVCTSLGLKPADVDALASDPMTELSDRVPEINLTCPSVAGSRQAAQDLIDELHLDEWHVSVRSGSGRCGVISIGGDDGRTLVVIPTSPP